MVRHQQRSVSRVVLWLLCAVLAILLPLPVAAQDNQPSLPIADIAKRVLLDPTTYTPAIVAYDATMRDWNSSQPFFRNGYLEQNPRFTISGRSNDVPLSYEAGHKRILKDALFHVQLAAAHNTIENVVERVLVERFPEKRKLWRVLGWIERGAYASYSAYVLSEQHYRQWRYNERMAAQLGLR
jgi:hypothetical protein